MKRNTGIDLLRILSMIMILYIHVLGQSGVMDLFDITSLQYRMGWIVLMASFCAVNVFALISGYVGVDVEFKYSKIIAMWLQVVFFTVGLTTVMYFVLPEGKVTSEHFIKAIMPIRSNRYWYYTAYFGMSFLIPALNHLINTMEQNKLKKMLICIIIFMSVYPSLVNKDLFQIANGFSMVWLMVLYLIGGYIKRYPLSDKLRPSVCFMIYALLIIISWVGKLYTDGLPVGEEFIKFNRYTAPAILLSAIVLLIGFSRLEIKHTKTITFVGPLCFGVYLTHALGVVFNNCISNKYGFMGSYGALRMLGTISLIVVFWFVLGIFIEFVRQKLFKLLHVEKLYVWKNIR